MKCRVSSDRAFRRFKFSALLADGAVISSFGAPEFQAAAGL